VAFGFSSAWWLHRARALPAVPAAEPLVRAIALAIGYALALDFADALSSNRISLARPSPASVAVPFLIVLAAFVARRGRAGGS
jgi:hypothetical protein